MFFLRQQWQRVVNVSSEVDLTFLLLRVFSLAGGIAWLLLAPLSQGEKAFLVKALIYFSVYSVLCYLVIFFRPGLLKKVYLASLFLDIIFLSNLVHAETNFESSFFLGYYLLISLHTIYFGLRFGLLVALFSAVCYAISIFPMITYIEWTDLAMRIGFLFFIAVPVGLLTEKVKRDKDKVENFNKTLETQVGQRTKKIGSLLGQERYLREILSTVAHINQLLITSPNVDSLLESSCARFVHHGHYYDFCWIGLLENGKIQTIHTSDITGMPLAAPPYDVFDADALFYRSTTAQCIRDNKTVIRENTPKTPDLTPWYDHEVMKGFQAVISLPLRAHQSAPPLGALTIYTWRKEGFEPEEKEMLDELAGDIGFAIDSYRQRESVTKLTAERTANYEETIFSFVDMIEQRDTYTAGHTQRVAQYCEMVARKMGFDLVQRKNIYKASILHDIGKIATPDSVLLKPGKLTSLDYDLIKLHPFAGYVMLSNIEMYKELAVIILHHHERHDGKGYPDGLLGDDIPPLSRIMVVCDAFDAMTTNRVYKSRKEIPEALAELQALSGSQFHPEVVKVAVKVLADVKIATTINQLPVNNLEKKRFSYFFNDMLTGLYNEDYLKIILNNLDLNQYKCLRMVHLLNVPEYNKRHGWANGNLLLKEFAVELQASFPESLIFRAYGNDFAIMSKEHLAVDSKAFNAFRCCIIDTGIEFETHHLDLTAGKEYTIDKLEKLEIKAMDSLLANN
ncbi:MAG: HD domain-containing protein [Proteobacteria bacterium]|nr:HD domain-containing protein [Desulfocapsa sp.]MBU3944732.1 HD domain-containing protein [Pseudomonadota bacterium]MCG2742685.1 HD domain-containing protein [Desulfobacteraceae bacterium]MBU3984234.1 HD domain-containing protein [Pseudomonadota bacterium]MBU4030364.1 HD domain-containing protein [Pseudomonadota bacterium]